MTRPDHWTSPRPYRDASLRLRANGPVQPMAEPTLRERLRALFRKETR